MRDRFLWEVFVFSIFCNFVRLAGSRTHMWTSGSWKFHITFGISEKHSFILKNRSFDIWTYFCWFGLKVFFVWLLHFLYYLIHLVPLVNFSCIQFRNNAPLDDGQLAPSCISDDTSQVLLSSRASCPVSRLCDGTFWSLRCQNQSRNQRRRTPSSHSNPIQTVYVQMKLLNRMPGWRLKKHIEYLNHCVRLAAFRFWVLTFWRY